MDEAFEIITVDADNVDRHGFFCYMSKRKAPGYAQKCAWLAARFAEGLKLHMVHETGGRTVGFIEYIPGEFAWRVVHAPGYLVIHCLWVVGKGKGKGFGTASLAPCWTASSSPITTFSARISINWRRTRRSVCNAT